MRKKVFYSVSVTLISALFFFSACDNKDDESFDINSIDIEQAEDDAIAEDVYNTIDAMIDDEVSTLDANNYTTESALKSSEEDDPYTCKVITIDHPNDSSLFPKIITIDYGEGCTVAINGNEYTRRGRIQVEVTNRWFLEGATRTTTFIDFYINEVKIEGQRTVSNLGENENGNLEFQHELTNGKLIFYDSLEYSRNANGIREWVRASSPELDEWYITGTRNGINAEGYEYSHEITERLRMIRCEAYNYQWMIVEGVVETSRNGQSGTLNYGNGTCDDTAILTIDGVQQEIQLRQRYHNRRQYFTGRN